MFHSSSLAGSALLAFLAIPPQSQSLAAWKDPSPHTVQFVTVDKDVRLEVLDWGGSGRPVVLLAGGGDTAHIFDDFAPKLTAHYHVYGITRRGFGASGYSAPDHAADRLGDDVVAVLDALNLKSPVLVGHSIAGVELSSVANNHPNRVAGLVYLDAAYSYAFDNGKGASVLEIQKSPGPQPPPPDKTDLASFGALQKYYLRVNGFIFPEAELRMRWESTHDGAVGEPLGHPGVALFQRLLAGDRKFNAIPAPALVIFANPHSQGAWVDRNTDPSVQTAAKAHAIAMEAVTEKQEKSVEEGVPTAHVVSLPNAHHYVFLSNEAEVLKQMDAFLAGLH